MRFAAGQLDCARVNKNHAKRGDDDKSDGDDDRSGRARLDRSARRPDQCARGQRGIARNVVRKKLQRRARRHALLERPRFDPMKAWLRCVHGAVTVSNTAIDTGLPMLMS